MGFRSMLATESTGLKLPKWFVDKWQNFYNINDQQDEVYLPITSKIESKYYQSADEDIFIDLQRVLVESDWEGDDFEIVLFHECGGITKVHIGKDFIKLYEPEGCHEVDAITHNYCYGCSSPTEDKDA